MSPLSTPPGRPRAQEPDEPFERLRAADPMAGAGAEPGSLRAAVERRLAEGDQEGRAPADELTDELAVRRRRRWTTAGRGAAAAVAVLAVLGGGYALGARHASPEPLGPTLATGPDPGARTGAATDGGPVMGGGAEALADMAAGPGRTVFTSAGLSSAPTTAEAYALDATGFDADRVRRIAEVLGLEGDVVEEYGWRVGSWEEERLLEVYAGGTAETHYYDGELDPWTDCLTVVEEPVEPLAEEGAPAEEGRADAAVECEAEGSAPESPVATARELVAELGLDPEDYQWEALEDDPGPAVLVRAAAVINGRPLSGLEWQITVTEGGVHSFSGPLAAVRELGEYDVVSPEEAVARLGDSRFGGALTEPGPVPMPMPIDEESPTPGFPDPVAPGEPIDWPVTEVTITGAELVLAPYHQASGAATLLPTYELTDDEGRSWSVLAVDEGHLDLG